MAKKKSPSAKTPWIIAILAILISIASVYSLTQANKVRDMWTQNPQAISSSKEERLGRMWTEFHRTNSESNITKYFPDATIIFSERKNETAIFKHYYSPEIDKTIISCERNATIAVCNGRFSRPLDISAVVECVIHPSVLLNLANYTGG